MFDNSKDYIVVSATALATSGALTILRQFVQHASKDNNNYLIFAPENLNLPKNDNIVYIENKPKGWAKRIVWDWYGCYRFLKKNKINVKKIVSLQNSTLYSDWDQIVYLHQPIPFSQYNSFLSDISINNFKLFLYKKFYAYFIFKFVNDRTKFVVQTDWMKDGVLSRCSILKPECIYVIKPDVKVFLQSEVMRPKLANGTILYPATPLSYKNHLLLLQALAILKETNPCLSFKLQVTFKKDEYRKFDELTEELKLNDYVEYLGVIDYKKLFVKYIEAAVISYPSYIESYGLPLIEAASLGKKIICSDLPYSKDVLKHYSGATFVKYNDPQMWASEILNALSVQTVVSFTPLENDERSSWPQFFELLK